jgi:hypothetical protein
MCEAFLSNSRGANRVPREVINVHYFDVIFFLGHVKFISYLKSMQEPNAKLINF